MEQQNNIFDRHSLRIGPPKCKGPPQNQPVENVVVTRWGYPLYSTIPQYPLHWRYLKHMARNYEIYGSKNRLKPTFVRIEWG